MNNSNISDEISLKLFDELAKEPLITQRVLADRLGIALGLVNAYIKRLYKKGHIKVKNLPKNRINISSHQKVSQKRQGSHTTICTAQ